MKRCFLVLVGLLFSASLMACGDSTASPPVQTTPNVQGTNLNTADDQALAERDCEQLAQFLSSLSELDFKRQRMAAMGEAVLDGSRTSSDMVAAAKSVAEDAQILRDAFHAAQWKSEVYAQHVALLSDIITAAYNMDKILYEAGSKQDETLLVGLEGYAVEYNDTLAELLALMEAQ